MHAATMDGAERDGWPWLLASAAACGLATLAGVIAERVGAPPNVATGLYAVAYIAYTIHMDRQRSDNVNHSAHLWGAAYGVVATVLVEPRLLGAFFGQLLRPSLM